MEAARCMVRFLVNSGAFTVGGGEPIFDPLQGAASAGERVAHLEADFPIPDPRDLNG